MWLSEKDLGQVIRHTPLVSIDLVVRDRAGRVLVGRRGNEPARGSWFVPGGRVRKNERLARAFARIVQVELGVGHTLEDATFLGVYEHLYDANCLDLDGVGTHYVVLAYTLQLSQDLAQLPQEQHDAYRWCTPEELRGDPEVHVNTRAYFADQGA